MGWLSKVVVIQGVPFVLLGCYTYRQHFWDSDSTETLKIEHDVDTWEECRDLCADWDSPTICEYWQHNSNGNCYFKSRVTCDQPPSLFKEEYSAWNCGHCVPPSDSTCVAGVRFGENMILKGRMQKKMKMLVPLAIGN